MAQQSYQDILTTNLTLKAIFMVVTVTLYMGFVYFTTLVLLESCPLCDYFLIFVASIICIGISAINGRGVWLLSSGFSHEKFFCAMVWANVLLLILKDNYIVFPSHLNLLGYTLSGFSVILLTINSLLYPIYLLFLMLSGRFFYATTSPKR